jgi:uncharacterized delta-60 repeat protein
MEMSLRYVFFSTLVLLSVLLAGTAAYAQDIETHGLSGWNGYCDEMDGSLIQTPRELDGLASPCFERGRAASVVRASASSWRRFTNTGDTVQGSCCSIEADQGAYPFTSFMEKTDDGFNPGANGTVETILVQPDGKILVAGKFTILGGKPRNYIGRLSPDGTLDDSFNPNAGSYVYALALQDDGKIVVGGQFTTMGGQPRLGIARLKSNGALDGSFNPGESGLTINTLALQSDDKILVGGRFNRIDGDWQANIARLGPDGSRDETFNPDVNNEVEVLLVQPDKKILVGGSFLSIDGESRKRIARLNSDGTLDMAFDPQADGTLCDGCTIQTVYSLALQADGKILVGGGFTILDGQTRDRIGRLKTDGTLDAAFNPGANSYVLALAVQEDGKIVVGGAFNELGGQSRNKIGRLKSNGTLDAAFNPEASSTVRALAVQANDKILVGGQFTDLGGQPLERIARLNPDGSLDLIIPADEHVINLPLVLKQ